MDQALEPPLSAALQDRRLADAVRAHGGRLRAFVRRRVADAGDAEDIVQEVFYELVLAYRLLRPIEELAGWLLRVARNRIVDRFRARAREGRVIVRDAPDSARGADGAAADEADGWLDALAALESGPEAEYLRTLVMDEFETALAELPRAEREVFIAHELEGRSFKELAAQSGVKLNTLLGRKHAAVRHLRARLRPLNDAIDRVDATPPAAVPPHASPAITRSRT